jgi:hypothetical protein
MFVIATRPSKIGPATASAADDTAGRCASSRKRASAASNVGKSRFSNERSIAAWPSGP